MLRELRRCSQSQVAKEAGISKSQLSKYENGHLPKLETLERLLTALGVEYFQFFFALYLVDRRAASLGRSRLPGSKPNPADTADAADALEPEGLIAEIRDEQTALLPPLLQGRGRASSLEKGFRKVFDDLLTLYRMAFEQGLAAGAGPDEEN